MKEEKLGGHVLPLTVSGYHWIVVNANTLAGLFTADQRLILVLELNRDTGEVYIDSKTRGTPIKEPILDLTWRVITLDRMGVEG